VWERFLSDAHVPTEGIISAWGSSELYDNNFIFNPYGSGWHLDRRRFDAMLALAAEDAGASVYLSTRVVSCTQRPNGGWSIEAICDGQAIALLADFLVEATGRASSLVGKPATKRIVCDNLIAVIKYFQFSSPVADCRTLVEASQSGWWYSAVLPNNHLVVAYMTDADLLPRGHMSLADVWRSRIQDVPHTLARVDPCVSNSSTRSIAAYSYRRNCVADTQWLAIGDAASAFDPLSSQGISKALQSGIAAAKVIQASQSDSQVSLNEYAGDVEKSFDKYLQARAAYYNREKRWSDSIFWQRRQSYASSIR
jgi:flavin-dependent dehydrogenase